MARFLVQLPRDGIDQKTDQFFFWSFFKQNGRFDFDFRRTNLHMLEIHQIRSGKLLRILLASRNPTNK